MTNAISGDMIWVIATASNTVVARISAGGVDGNSLGVAITPNGEFAYVTNRASGTVSVIATASNTVVATIPVDGAPAGVAITPNGKFAYVSNFSSNGAIVSVIATASNTVVATIPVGGHSFHVTWLSPPMGNSPT